MGLEAHSGMSDEIFGLLFETAPHPYLVLRADETFTIVAVNERYLDATGSDRSAIMGRGLFEVFPDNPDDTTATGVGDLRTSLERVKRERAADVMGVQKYDIPSPGSKGKFEVKYWSPVNTPVCDADGTLLYIIHHVEDVTDFILSREQASKGSGERIGHVQARADRMESEVILRAGEVKEANRQIKAVVEELERRKGELARLNEQLKDLDRAKTAFFSNISHEFRTPLTLMLGSLQEALGDTSVDLPEVQRGQLAVARRNALRLLKLVNALLDFTRVEAGRTQDRLRAHRSGCSYRAAGKSFPVGSCRSGSCPHHRLPAAAELVYVDPGMWETIVLNIVSNAYKFTHRGSIGVTMRVSGGSAHLTVRDTGIGIPTDELPKLFERFHRVEGSQGRSHEGSGIGLALVRELVQLHGGTISVESTLGQGSAFHVALPLGMAHLPADRIRDSGRPSKSAERAEAFIVEALSWLPDPGATNVEGQDESEGAHTFDGADPGVSRPRVLLADDNADMRTHVGSLLHKAGYQVSAVADGEQALAACFAKPPDLVLTDAMMPKLDGFGLVTRLRRDARTALLPIILLSARAGEEARIDGLKTGADDYIVKPFGSRELLARVDAAVRLSHARREAMIREAEMARLRASFDDAAVGMAHVATDGRWLRVNDRLCAMIGYSRSELLGTTFQNITHPDDLATDIVSVNQLLAGEIATYAMEKRYFRKDGKIVWINLTVSLVRKADGTPDYFLSVIDDITGRKRADIDLAESRSRLAGVVEFGYGRHYNNRRPPKRRSLQWSCRKAVPAEAAEIVGQPLSLLLPQRFGDVHIRHINAFARTGVSNRTMGRPGPLAALRADGRSFQSRHPFRKRSSAEKSSSPPFSETSRSENARRTPNACCWLNSIIASRTLSPTCRRSPCRR